VTLSAKRTGLFDPPDDFAKLRNRRPVRLRYTNGDAGWLVTSHALAKAILTDSRFGRGDDIGTMLLRSPLGDPTRLAEFQDALEPYEGWRHMQGFIFMDPPEHTRYRRLLSPYFSARRLETFRPRIEQIVAKRLEAMEEAGPPVDLVRMFAAQVSLGSQCTLLGIPVEEAERFYWLAKMGADPAVQPREVVAAEREAWEYVRTLTARKRLDPGDDVISDICRHPELSDDEVADTALVLFLGGLDTTGDMLAVAVFILLCHPDQLDALRDDPTRIETAVEELLRYAGTSRFTPRTALEDVDLDGMLIRARETVQVSLAAANRDPEKFDEPDRLDLERSASGHLAFAQGIHMCLGQHLARIELQVGLSSLIQRFPTLRLAVPADEVPVDGPERPTFGVRELPVAWDT
jgi:cytochrome P450